MSAITLVFAALSAVSTFVIAAVVIGREALRLDSVAPRAVYDPDEATKFVADHLPEGTQSRLTYDELRKLLILHMRWMHEKGLQPSDVADRKQGIDSTLVVGEETLAAYLFGKADEANIDLLDDVDVVHVVRAHLDYFDAIGAVGPSASINDL
jgi:YD repeat-containing protein